MFYAYTKEYMHNDCFLITKQTFTLYKKQNFTKIQNVCDPYIWICIAVVKWTCFFFDVIINHFLKINRSVLRKITIDLLYFWDVYDFSLWEKNYSRSTAYKAEAVFRITYFKTKESSWEAFLRIVVLQCSFCALVKAWRNL